MGIRLASFRRVGAIGVAAVVAAVLGLTAGPVSADVVDIDVGESYINGEPGSAIQIGSTTVPAELVGRNCDVVAEIANGGSVHVDNTLIVTSGDSTVQIAEIENVADSVTRSGGTLTLAATIEVAVQFGTDGISSLGSSLSLTCQPLPAAPPPPPVPGTPTYTG